MSLASLASCSNDGGDGDEMSGDDDDTAADDAAPDDTAPDDDASDDDTSPDDVPASGHCTPGEPMNEGRAYGSGALSNCPDYDVATVGGGVSPDAFGVRSIRLDTPIGPGDVLAFSADMQGAIVPFEMELWGTDESCGAGLELLASAPLTDGMRCMEARPANGAYPNLLWVWPSGSLHGDVTICPAGACPAP